jgi:aspartate kinase
VTAITGDANIVCLELTCIANDNSMLDAIFTILKKAKIIAETIIHTDAEQRDKLNIKLVVNKIYLNMISDISQQLRAIGGVSISQHNNNAKLTLVGHQLHNNLLVLQNMFQMLHKADINILGVMTSVVSISVLIESEHMQAAVRALHDGFLLGAAA